MDTRIKREFDRCEADGLCRSDVAGLRMKWIQGKKHMIAQYHPTWESVKRKPYFVKPSMTEPFSKEAFNFTKVKEPEVLARLTVQNGKVIFLDKNELPQDNAVLYTILLNVSPICNNHHLIVPNLASCYSQVWRNNITIDLLNMCSNSERDDYVLFFNSLGGFSSVNHLHFQVMYASSFYETAKGSPDPAVDNTFTPMKLPLEYEPTHLLCKYKTVFVEELNDWLCQTIKLRIEKEEDQKDLADCLNDLIQACYDYDYPYDVVMCNHGTEVYVFIRRYQQPLNDLRVNPACVELTGIVVYRSEETFTNANEEILMKRCKEVVCFEDSVWKAFTTAFVNRINK